MGGAISTPKIETLPVKKKDVSVADAFSCYRMGYGFAPDVILKTSILHGFSLVFLSKMGTSLLSAAARHCTHQTVMRSSRELSGTTTTIRQKGLK